MKLVLLEADSKWSKINFFSEGAIFLSKLRKGSFKQKNAKNTPHRRQRRRRRRWLRQLMEGLFATEVRVQSYPKMARAIKTWLWLWFMKTGQYSGLHYELSRLASFIIFTPYLRCSSLRCRCCNLRHHQDDYSFISFREQPPTILGFFICWSWPITKPQKGYEIDMIAILP